MIVPGAFAMACSHSIWTDNAGSLSCVAVAGSFSKFGKVRQWPATYSHPSIPGWVLTLPPPMVLTHLVEVVLGLPTKLLERRCRIRVDRHKITFDSRRQNPQSDKIPSQWRPQSQSWRRDLPFVADHFFLLFITSLKSFGEGLFPRPDGEQ